MILAHDPVPIPPIHPFPTLMHPSSPSLHPAGNFENGRGKTRVATCLSKCPTLFRWAPSYACQRLLPLCETPQETTPTPCLRCLWCVLQCGSMGKVIRKKMTESTVETWTHGHVKALGVGIHNIQPENSLSWRISGFSLCQDWLLYIQWFNEDWLAGNRISILFFYILPPLFPIAVASSKIHTIIGEGRPIMV